MTGSRKLVTKLASLAPLAAAAILGSALLTSGTLNAAERRVAIGEVRSEVARRDVDMTALVRTTVETELARMDPAKTVGKRRAILSVALLAMDTKTGKKGPFDTCRMVATVRDARKGALLATFETDAKSPHVDHSAQADRAMVESAVQGIVLRLPEALK